ncbi:TonB-dependent receptor [Bacteroidales bacterium OttesenSCG-928-B11]|nr:TonB-dependent receptor [Bacteroidales bacterium OttesenSCG-928-E04]MDL2308206.1 TonB-dependent receptor [Bacteroidales bacterium OttesenSCG-928-C03]MDL2312580.1 TonB-dependent receptor [Bacteroidales bacterium OttesenSCG-928-B11]MDL2325644.1 TonB-dependent receptor [Bacteroidales bacterium OttesenSCG-928-A14]
MKKIAILSIVLISFANIAFSQKEKTDANVVGHVLNKETQEHLAGVPVDVEGTALGTYTDKTGHYNLTHLQPGNYTLVAHFFGYKAQKKEIVVEQGKTLEVHFELEEENIMLDQVVVSASKTETSRKEAVSIVNVITPKSFENTSSSCLAEGLNYQPGLRVENNCQNCGFPQLRINGLEGPYTQILIDSRAINSALAGVYGLEHIPVNMVERVEVVRGGGSALFGSNAVAGTVNIITKESYNNGVTLSQNTSLINGNTPDWNLNLSASLVSSNNRAGVTLFGATRQRKPYDANDDGFSEIGSLNFKSVGFRGYYRTGSLGKISVEYHAINEFRRGGNNFTRPPHEADIAEQTDHTINSGGVKYDIFTKNAKHGFQIYSSLQHINRDSYYGAGQDPDAYGNTKDLALVGGTQYTFRMNKFLFMPATLIAGVEYAHNQLNDLMLGYNREINQKIDIYSVFAQNEWKVQRASILLGARLDKHSMIDGVIFNPRVSGRYEPWKWLTLRASYASGYRGPQAFDEDLHVTAVGGGVSLIHLAEDLKPEKSHSFTLSAEFSKNFSKRRGFMFLAEGFYTNLKDVFLLEETGLDASGNILMERRNGSGATVAGVNLEANVTPVKDLQFNLGFTLQSSLYKEPEQWSEAVSPQRRMFRSPSNYGYLTALYTPVKNLDLSLTGVYTGSMLVQHFAGYVAEDMEKTTPAFFDLGLKVAYNFKLKENIVLQLNVGMKNIINSYQKDFDLGENRDAGYIYGPALPRTLFFGMKFVI